MKTKAIELNIRRADKRGHADHGWLNSHHTFSFADYYDPAQMGFRSIRVINDDRVSSGKGFGTHPHRDMEIFSYVLEGALEHKDSLGNGRVLKRGEIQLMSAGQGVTHSEFNPSPSEPLHFLQIWILPNARGIAPSYEQKRFSAQDKRGALRLVVSPDGAMDSVTIHADARLYAGLFDGNEGQQLSLDAQRLTYVFVARGSLRANAVSMAAGDALLLTNEQLLTLADGKDAEVLVFDLAP